MDNVEEKVVQILTEKINDLEHENEVLKNKVSLLDNVKNFAWLAHTYFTPEENVGLPLPRLEMRYEKEGHWLSMVYGLVRKHYVDGIEFIPFSKTTTSTNADRYLEEMKLAIVDGDYETLNKQLPYRDGVHIKYDSMSLGLPIILSCVIGDKTYTRSFTVSAKDKEFINSVVNREK